MDTVFNRKEQRLSQSERTKVKELYTFVKGQHGTTQVLVKEKRVWRIDNERTEKKEDVLHCGKCSD